MDSLDAAPSADYASLITVTMPNDTSQQNVPFGTFDRNQNLNKANQEHIYAQVSSNSHCETAPPATEVSNPETVGENKPNALPNKALMNNTILIRNPTVALGHSSSTPDVRRTYPSLLNVCQSSYGSLNVAKEKEKALAQKTEPTAEPSVFSISGRRVVVSNGYNGNGSNPRRLNNIREPVEPSNLPNEWTSRSTLNSGVSATRLQICTDCLSLCLFVPGTVLCILSPWLLVPIYIIPSFHGSHFQTLIWISCIGSAILVFMGCMVGNMVWYRRGDRWKCKLHCGKGPKNHYWGDALTSKRTVHIV